MSGEGEGGGGGGGGGIASHSNENLSPYNDADNDMDICRVCRCEASPDKPLFYPCVCTGSIKYIHQECLIQWLKYSKKEYCELCKHKFSFAPIYHPDMPQRLPARDILVGLLRNMCKGVKFWLHSLLVAISWLGIVPLTACRIYRCLFSGSFGSLLTLPLDMLATDNIVADILQGVFVVLCSLGAFISLVWLREQILSGGGPDWLDAPADAAAAAAPPHHANNADNNNNNNRMRLRARLNQHLNQIANQPAAPAAQRINPNDNNMEGDDDDGGNMDDDDAEADAAGGNRQQINDDDDDDVRDEAAGPAAAGDAAAGAAGAAAGPVNDDNHWNPMEWDRAAEDLTWDRLLGFDGSLLFLEHVFWVISLNTLFIMIFAFCPYHIGHYAIASLNLSALVDSTHFEGLVTIIVGYTMLAMLLATVYSSMVVSRSFYRARKLVGICFIVIKVALLVVFEICVFPLVCGAWLDVCSLSLFNATLGERVATFEQAPGTSAFIHWLVGMIYVFYFATFVFVLREVLRPGILWFLRNLNDPDFNPVQEMIQLPVYRHMRRFLTSVLLFGFSISLMLYAPVCLLNAVATYSDRLRLLPYRLHNTHEALASELSVELLWLHAALPALLEQSHIRIWAKNVLRAWAVGVAWLLDIRSFLIGDSKNNATTTNNNNNNNNNNGIGADAGIGGEQQGAANNNNNRAVQPQQQQQQAQQQPQQQQQQQPQQAQQQNPFQFNVGVHHQVLLQNNAPFVNEPYTRPTHFNLRLAAFLVISCVSLFLASLVTIVVPATLGRWLLYHCTGQSKYNELYTIIAGLYTMWLGIRVATILCHWIHIGFRQLYVKFRQQISIMAKTTVAVLLMFGFLPLLFGFLFQKIVINPISTNPDQTPVISLWQVWALGVLHTKILTALVLTGPQWWLRQAVDRIFNDGFRNIDLNSMIFKLVYPVSSCLGLAIAIPCVLSRSIAPLFFDDEDFLNNVERRIYPFSLFATTICFVLMHQVKQFKRLYERIRNDKYLVGQRLINFERNLS